MLVLGLKIVQVVVQYFYVELELSICIYTLSRYL